MRAVPRKRLGLVVASLGAALIIAVVFLAPSRQSSDGPGQRTAAPREALDEVAITDFLFKPPAITVAAGTTVTFTNQDAAPHTATSGASPNADDVFDTGTLEQGQSGSVTLTKTGTFAYYCEFHPFMKATVTVR